MKMRTRRRVHLRHGPRPARVEILGGTVAITGLQLGGSRQAMLEQWAGVQRDAAKIGVQL